MRASGRSALAFLLFAPACADVHATGYDAGALSPIGPLADAGGPSKGSGGADGGSSSDAGSSPGTVVDASLPPAVDGGGASGSPVPGADGGLPTPLPSTSSTWLSQVIYLVMPDRFQNGDPSNDDLGVPNCFDPTNASKWHGGDIAGLRQRIPYLQDLGVTAVWITPQYAQAPDPRCGYHGYWADFVDADDGSVEPKMGTPTELAGLSNDLHAAGIRLVLDMVVNHSGIGARIDTQHPDWFHDPKTCSQLGDPNIYCPVGGQPLPDFAQESPVVASYLTAMSVGWVTRYGVDGIRMDTVKNVLPAYWATWFPAIRAAQPGVFVVGEDFDESGPTGLSAFLDDGFDSLFDYPRYPTLVSTFGTGGAVDALANAVQAAITTYGMARARQMTSFVDNHDNPRLTSQFPTGTADADVAARFRLAQGASFTLPGIPEIMWGDEIAMYGGSGADDRRDMPSWAWTAASRAGAHAGMAAGDGQANYVHMQTLIQTRKAHVALQQGSYAELWRQNGGVANVLAFHRGAGADHVIVAINPGAAATVSLPITASNNLTATDKQALPNGTVLTDALGEGAPATVTVAGGVLPMALPAESMGIYVVQ